MANEIVVPMRGQRDIRAVTAELLIIKQQTQEGLLRGSIEMGKRLEEAKGMLPHGEWGRWLQEEVEFSQSTANNLMKVAREYGPQLAAGNSQAIANLTYTKAIKLLAVPAEDREAFVEANGVAEMSTRELDKAIKEAKAKAEALKAQTAALEAAEKRAKDAEKAQKDAEKLAKAMEKDLAWAGEKANEYGKELLAARKAMDEAKAEADDLRMELAAAQNQPAKVERIEVQVPADTTELEAKIKAAEEKAAEAEKKLKAFKPEVAGFQAIFNGTQQNINSMLGYIQKLTIKGDTEIAGKLCDALESLAQKLTDASKQGRGA